MSYSVSTTVLKVPTEHAEEFHTKFQEFLESFGDKVEKTSGSVSDEITYAEKLESLLEENGIEYDHLWDEVRRQVTQ